MPSAARWCARRRRCTASCRRSATTAPAFFAASTRRSRRRAIIRWWSSASSLPRELTVTADTDDGVVMGLAHTQLPVHGVQFHPESIASEHGHLMLKNFLDIAAAWNASTGRRQAAAPNPPQRRASAGAIELIEDGTVTDNFRGLIGKVATGAALSREEAAGAFEQMMSGEATPSQMGALLMALARARRDRRRDHRRGHRDARQDAARRTRRPTPSTWSAPAATLRARSTFRPARR